ncbi:steroid 17-alpha-hydroxylase/17,20 lyase [Aplysia californica]|uniref:Steroid 17-alpha-hydroxylase/17,20 lyase n=1 Tax=Aplysia californica TaxID=6500 RepID=A0ABM1A5P7_APLCA|nr:steroid 17-alpha-hydroxylase/17,20 lyase [Aplysia californica]
MFVLLRDALTSTMATVNVTQMTLAVVTFGLVVHWVVKRNSVKLPHGPRPLPFFGNLWELNGIGLADKATEWKDKYGPVFTMYLGSKPTVVINSIEAMTEAFTTRGDDFANRPHSVSQDALTDNGKNIAFADFSESLKFRRKNVMQSLRQYLTGSQHTERVHDVLEIAVDNIKQEKGPFDLETHTFHIVCNVLHVLCFGRTLGIDDKDFLKLKMIFQSGIGEFGNTWEDVIPFLRHFPTKHFRHFLNINNEFLAYIQKGVHERRANLNENDSTTLIDDILLTQQKLAKEKNSTLQAAFTDSHITQTLSDVFFAGIDTTRLTLGWIFLYLALNPDVQKKVQTEIDDIVGDAVPGREHRPGLVYTEAVILEIMRLFPVAPMGLPHETVRDTQVMGYDIPAKTEVMANQYAILRDPNHWDQPESFVPERYLDKDGGKLTLKPKSWIPFSIGQRSCVGEFLARQSILYITTGLLQKLDFSLDPNTPADLTPQVGFVFRACKPFKVIAKSRR